MYLLGQKIRKMKEMHSSRNDLIVGTSCICCMICRYSHAWFIVVNMMENTTFSERKNRNKELENNLKLRMPVLGTAILYLNLHHTINMMEEATKEHCNRDLVSALASNMHQSIVSTTECKSSLTWQPEEDVSTNTTTYATNAGSNNDDSIKVSAASVHAMIGDRHCDRSA
jgi:23S rRNA A1618 N6-methylase RlmF